MFKKCIAGALLVVVVAWAEMALAPMFIMQVWHVHPAREVAEHMAGHHHAMPVSHPCCPGIHTTASVAPFQFAAENLPCQDEHRCCFRQGPLSVPVPVRAGRGISPAISSGEVAELRLPATSNDFSATVAVPGPPPGLLGMVQRI
ncbi:MAG: hypothetical protein WAK29_16450 [Terriglobales bacterium]